MAHPPVRTLDAVGELAFIDSIQRLARGGGRGVKIGIGDDAAVVVTTRSTVLTTDTQRENVHFRRDWLSPAELGRRAFRVAVSDAAAMAAIPRYVLLSFGAPAHLDAAWARRVIAGLVAEARKSKTALVGGNVSRDDAVSLVVTVVADAGARVLRRSDAQPGDVVWVSGALGCAAAGVELLERGVRDGPLVNAYRKPPLRIELARALAGAGVSGAMIDVSDGLLTDLGHVCRASGVSARLALDRVPLARALREAAARSKVEHDGHRRPRGGLRRPAIEYALAGGDDYELLFTSRAGKGEAALRSSCEALGCVISPVGTMTEPSRRPRITDFDGRPLRRQGYSHFAKPA